MLSRKINISIKVILKNLIKIEKIVMLRSTWNIFWTICHFLLISKASLPFLFRVVEYIWCRLNKISIVAVYHIFLRIQVVKYKILRGLVLAVQETENKRKLIKYVRNILIEIDFPFYRDWNVVSRLAINPKANEFKHI